VLASVLMQPPEVDVSGTVWFTGVGPVMASVIACVAGDTYRGRRMPSQAAAARGREASTRAEKRNRSS